MDRVEGVRKRDAGWITRFIYRMADKRYRLIPKSKTLAAHHTPGLVASTWMDRLCAPARTVPFALKELVQLKVATMAGCPF
jgi:hypothetical protein